MMMKSATTDKMMLCITIIVVITAPTCFCENGDLEKLKPQFYHKSCPQVETIVQDITWNHVKANPSLAAKLLRLHYHDCFVRGCDASVLLDSVGNNTAEKDAPPNRSLSGYDVIDEIKSAVEEQCPDTVSCADILALSARDAVSFQFERPIWRVFTGRRDGRISVASEASEQLPSARADFATLQQQFSDNGLDVTDLVALSGAHTIGMAHCGVFSTRLNNFTGKGDTDPSLNSEYANQLKTKCSRASNSVEMDPTSSLSFDSHYFVALGHNKGLFQSDAALLTDTKAQTFAKNFENFHVFMVQFGHSIKKMGDIGVLTQNNNVGEIRKNCRLVN